jgi:hypothetical protein
MLVGFVITVNDKIKMFTADGKTSTFHEQKDLEKFWNRSVCAKCNNGGCRALRWRSIPSTSSLRGREFNKLGLEEVETFARWTGKTTIVLGYLTPSPAVVPEFIRRTFLPDSPTAPHMRLFYASITADKTSKVATCNSATVPKSASSARLRPPD